MGVTIKELNDFYKPKNELWDFAGLEPWLVKKGIEQDVINATLKQTLLDFDLDTLPETNFIFDNTVYLRALVTKDLLRKAKNSMLEQETQESVRKSDRAWYSMSKLKRIWLVIIGRD